MLNIALRNTKSASTTLRRVDILRASVRGCTGGRRYATTLGIRREDPKRIWERRVPLTPEAVETLIKDGDDVKVEVESCERRCFPNDSYTKVGARIVPRLTRDVDIVLGIKEPPVAEVDLLIKEGRGKDRTWMVFSHTHKGQRYNTELLSSFMDKHKSQTLIDHELLTAPTPNGDLKRVAAFGWYAGAVGAGEALTMTGLALLKRGVATPLLHLPRPYTFTSLDKYKKGLGKVGDKIRKGTPTPDGPVVIGLTGAGNVSKGAEAMLEALGVEWVTADELPKLQTRSSNGTGKIYACAIPPLAYFAREDGTYSREDYYSSPQSYSSTFSTKIAPYLTTLINGAGWKPNFPRVINDTDMTDLIQSSDGTPKLVAVQDVTCDIKGNLEFVDRYTTIDQPYFEGPAGMMVSTIDILPTELAKDASEHFSKCLMPYMKHLSSPSSNDTAIRETLDRATIVKAGVLTAPHEWLQPRIEEIRAKKANPPTKSSGDKQKILLLGSGLVAGPAVEVFAARPDVHLVIGSNNLSEAQNLLKGRSNVEALSLDVSDSKALAQAVANSDVVVSLLPAPMHVSVAGYCIELKKHLVTASYISPEMKALHEKAKKAGVTLLGECGLDPGIDSMAAMRILERVKSEGKKVTSFVSWCGGLPEPVASNVPLGYKFSWSPRAVLTAAQNDAQYKLDGKLHQITGHDLLKKHFPDVKLWKGLALEGLANRDSLPYAEKYGLGPVEELKDLFRGTLRYKGFSELLDAFRLLGLLSTTSLKTKPSSWNEFLTASLAQAKGEESGSNDALAVMESSHLSPAVVQEASQALEWLGLLGSSPDIPLPNLSTPTPIDYFAALLSHKLAYLPHERDSALLHHAFSLTSPDAPGVEQKVTASLLCYGTEEGSAMSITVGKTLAFAALRVLDGHVKGRGVKGPYEREVWEGVLNSLEEVGVRVEEKWE